MKCVSYNIQYGIGLDGRYDIGRIVDRIRGADVIALQEVSRNNPQNKGHDMVAEIREALPDYFSVYGPNFEVDMGSHLKDGRAVDIRFTFGNMVLSRQPIMSSRNLLLPRRRTFDTLNLQRGALEALIQVPGFGPMRFYSVHLDHRGPEERAMQIRFLMDRVVNYPREGGAVTGVSENGFPEPPLPEAFVLMGDFNMIEGSAEYREMAGTRDPEFGVPRVADRGVDAALHVAEKAGTKPATTWVEPKAPADTSLHKRIDYCFVWAGLAHRLKSSHVDQEAEGSDHQPVWIELA